MAKFLKIIKETLPLVLHIHILSFYLRQTIRGHKEFKKKLTDLHSKNKSIPPFSMNNAQFSGVSSETVNMTAHNCNRSLK